MLSDLPSFAAISKIARRIVILPELLVPSGVRLRILGWCIRFYQILSNFVTFCLFVFDSLCGIQEFQVSNCVDQHICLQFTAFSRKKFEISSLERFRDKAASLAGRQCSCGNPMPFLAMKPKGVLEQWTTLCQESGLDNWNHTNLLRFRSDQRWWETFLIEIFDHKTIPTGLLTSWVLLHEKAQFLRITYLE